MNDETSLLNLMNNLSDNIKSLKFMKRTEDEVKPINN